MSWREGIIALLVGVPLVLQGISLVSRARPWRRLGILNLLLAGLGFVFFSMMASGVVVFGREFGVVMVEGSWGQAGLIVLLIGLPVAAGLGLHVVGTATGSTIRLEWVLILGFVIGAAASLCVSGLNASAPLPLRVYEYDLWWPVWLGWMAICLFGSGFAISRIVQRGHWLVFCLAALSLLAIIAVGRSRLRFSYGHPSTRMIWLICLCLGFPALLAMGAWLLRISWPRTLFDARAWRWTLTIAVLLTALASCAVWAYGEVLTPVFVFFSLVAAVTLVVIVVRTVPHLRTWRAAGYPIHDVGRAGRWDDIAALAALMAIIAAIVDLIYSGFFPPLMTFATLVLAWLVIVEVATGSLRQTGDLGAEQQSGTLSPLAHASRNAASALRDFMSGSISRIQKYFQADSWPAAAIKTVVAVLAGVVILVVCAELPNVGKTTVMPFSVTLPNDPNAKTDELEKKLSRVIPDRVLNALGLLRLELRTEVMTLSPMSDAKARSSRIDTASATPAGWEAVLARSSDLKIGGVEVPLSVLTAPIQSIMRSLVGERVISGSFYAGQSAFTLHATSSDGDYWRAEFPSNEHDHPRGMEIPTAAAAKGDPLEAAAALAEQIAFQMISRDPAMSSAGMTESWAALQDFRLGLADWRRYDAGNPDQLTHAIEHFQHAIEKDRNFALAYYRLGLAYEDDGQPARAVKQLQASIDARPDFAAGYNELAYVVNNFDDFRPAPETMPSSLVSTPAERKMQRDEAAKLWRRVLLLPAQRVPSNERFSAYYGLCSLALENHENRLAYFLARRAEQAYAKLSPELQEQATIQNNRATVADAIGVAIAQTSSRWAPREGAEWRCSGWEIASVVWQGSEWMAKRRVMSSPYYRAAARHYEQALTLSPDDHVVRCNAATAYAALGEFALMEKLEGDPAARVQLARALRKKGSRKRVGYYALALREYKAALRMDSANLEALSGYAYTFWLWRINAPSARPPNGPGPDVAHDAERYARRILRLVRGNVTPSTEASYQSTLGEVLLGQGRVHEAIQVLKEAYANAPRSTQYDAIPYDLAQAYLEADFDKVDLGLAPDEDSAGDKGVALLTEIWAKQKQQEDFAYKEAELLDPRPLLACSRSPEASVERAPAPNSPHYEVHARYESGFPCNWIGVNAEVKDAQPGQRFKLHVWGGGVDERIDVQQNPKSQNPVILTSQPVHTQFYYFAQLEDQDREPLSSVEPVETFPNDDKDSCEQNAITLIFQLPPER